MQLRTVETERLTVGYAATGPASGWPVILLHGFLFVIHAFDAVAPVLADAGPGWWFPISAGSARPRCGRPRLPARASRQRWAPTFSP
jgi:pimeloyl-ACP methyl ester carboxylesterase